MKVLSKSPTYYLMLESYLKACSQGRYTSNYKEIADTMSYDKVEGMDTFKIFQDVVVLDQNLLSILDTDEVKMIARISKELYMNNALWFFERTTSTSYRTIKKLIDRDIIKSTEDHTIFVVNPQFIRRGTIPSVLAQTMNLLSSSSMVHKSMIHDLRYKKVIVNQIDRSETLY